jgi:hypothetical protein
MGMNVDLQSLLPTLIAVPVVAFLLYRRAKRSFGKQPLAEGRMKFRMALLGLISLMLIVTCRTIPGAAAGAFGLALGLVLATVGLKHTSYEMTPSGKFYTPNTWVGLAVTALFMGRLAARMFTVYHAVSELPPGANPGADFQRSPFTFAAFFLLAGYYLLYYAGVMRKGRTLSLPPAPAPAPAPEPPQAPTSPVATP